MIGLVFAQAPIFEAWLAKKLEIPKLQTGSKTIAVVNGNKISAVIAYSDYNGVDCYMSVAGEGNWLNRSVLEVAFKYPFIQIGCRRVTVFCKDSNIRAQKFAKKLGFVEEGILRHFFEDGANCHVLGLLREDCKFIG